MKYFYYPGCSLKGSGRPYEESFLQILNRLQVPYEELPDWNCCGATAYMSIDKNYAYALAARNLALASGHFGAEEVHVIAPCNACFLVLLKAQKALQERSPVGIAVGNELQKAGMQYNPRVKVRHPLDVLVHDVDPQRLRACVTHPLKGCQVACYYGCQVVRPYAPFDNQNDPQTMDHLLKTMGATPVGWSLKALCCGGTLTGTVEEAGQRLSYCLLKEAQRRGANLVATACPLCQFNLECYQGQMSKRWETPIEMPVFYFTQLIGLAMGISPKKLGIRRMLVQPTPSCFAAA